MNTRASVFRELHGELLRAFSDSRDLLCEATFAGVAVEEIAWSDQSIYAASFSLLRHVESRGAWAQLLEMFDRRLTPNSERAQHFHALVRTYRGDDERQVERIDRIVDHLRQGRWESVLREKGAAPDNAGKRTMVTLIEEVTNGLCDPWWVFTLLEEPSHPDRIPEANRVLSGMEVAYPFLLRRGCDAAARATALQTHRIRLALARVSGGSALRGLCPYQAALRFASDGHHSTAARVTLLWCAGLLYDMLVTDPRTGHPIAVNPMDFIVNEAYVAQCFAMSLRTPEGEIQRAIDAALEAINDVARADEDAGISCRVVISRLCEELLDEDIDVQLVASLWYPERAHVAAKASRRVLRA